MHRTSKLSPLQLELLRVYSFNPTEEELLEIKSYLGKFFAKKLIDKVENMASRKGITEADLDKWLNGDVQ